MLQDNPQAGFSTVGAIVTLVLSALVLGQLMVMVIDSQRGFLKSNAKVSAASSARYAHLALTRLIRFAGADPQGISFIGIDPDPRGHGAFDNIRLRADFNPADGDISDSGEDLTFWLWGDTVMVKWGSDAAPEPYLFGVDSLAFEYFNRNGAAITDPDLVPSHTASVQLTVRGSTEIYGEKRGELLSGRVTLRNGG
jgi:hypothetical protein